jgi:hypothetical protein
MNAPIIGVIITFKTLVATANMKTLRNFALKPDNS